MSRVPPWFERKFEFTLPMERYSTICVRLRGAPARLDEMLADTPVDVLISRPGGKWSAQEHAGHLLDLEPLWMARLNDFLTAGDGLTEADLSNRRTFEANHNTRPIREILAGFREARMGLVNRAEDLEPEAFARALEHPRLKQPMRLVDHLYFVAEHDDHHLAVIWELIH
ncbi:MAG TPA: DinB family protein [Bryobacteraceae bacterium]|nr:DinB family protein [Bryobacteraceae bacterium]